MVRKAAPLRDQRPSGLLGTELAVLGGTREQFFPRFWILIDIQLQL